MSFIYVAVGLMIVGGGISAYGQYQQGQAQKKMYQYQADVNAQQAIMAQRAADANVKLTQYQASQDAKMLQRKYMLVEGSQRAAFAAQGLGGGSVTEGDIATDTFKTMKLDENMIRYNADIKSWEIRNRSANEIWKLEAESRQFTYAGKSAARAGAISGTGTIFSSVGSAIGIGTAYGAKTPSATPTGK